MPRMKDVGLEEQQKQEEHQRPAIPHKVLDAVEEAAEKRLEGTGKLKMDDYFAGASTALYALGYEFSPAWVFGVMRGEIGNLEVKGKHGFCQMKKVRD